MRNIKNMGYYVPVVTGCNPYEVEIMKIFRPAPEAIASGGEHIRKRILEGYYALPPHADKRMAERGISTKDVIDCIRNGNICAASQNEQKQDYICMSFWYGKTDKELIVPVRAVFGDYDAKPIILTAYHNEDYVPEGELDDVVEHVVVEKIVTKAPADMTDEELEAELANRRAAKAKKARQVAQARANDLESKKARLVADRSRIDKDLAAITDELAHLVEATA